VKKSRNAAARRRDAVRVNESRNAAARHRDSERVNESRNAAARHRARLAKGTLASLAALTFLSGIGATRAHFASRHKRKPSALAAPQRFTRIVQRDLLAAGIMAPAQAPSDVATSVS
jgi:hypothetical protein